MPITQYQSYSVPAYEGQVTSMYSGEQTSGVVSRTSVAAGQIVFPGRIVNQSAINNDGITVTSAVFAPYGISIGQEHYEKASLEPGFSSAQALSAWDGNIAGLVQQPKTAYQELDPCAVLRKGYIWMIVEGNFAAGGVYSTVNVRLNNGGATAMSGLGRLAATPSAGTTALAVNGAATQQPVFRVIRSFTNANGGLIQAYWDFVSSNTTAI